MNLQKQQKDMKKLDHSAQIQVLKGITKVSGNPLPAEEGVYGKPLGNKSGSNLTNFMKIKFGDLGIRVVYRIESGWSNEDYRFFLPELMNKFTKKQQKEERMEDIIVKIVDLENEINQDIDMLVDLKSEIMQVIKKVDDLELQTLLEQRYLNFRNWEQIAVDMGYNVRHLYRMHDKVLKAVIVPK